MAVITKPNLINMVELLNIDPISTFYQGDCLVESQNIADGSVDLILTDLPYGTVKNIADRVASG